VIKIKHLLDAVETDDGTRLWVEPIGLTKDLKEWCKVDQILCHVGPPMQVWRFFEEHPDTYDRFRGKYHEWLGRCRYKPGLQQLATAGLRETFTLIHQGDDPEHNSATALYEFLSELAAYSPKEPPETTK